MTDPAVDFFALGVALVHAVPVTDIGPVYPVTGSGTPQRRNNVRGVARRRDILDAAEELFAAHGSRGTGLVEVAKKVGISHVGVLHHFGSKENLLRAVVQDRDERQAVRHAGVASLRGTEALRRLLESGREAGIRDPLSPLLLTLMAENLGPQEPLNTYFRQRYARTRALVVRAVVTGQDDGEFRADVDPESVAQQCLAMLIGIAAQCLVDPSVPDDNGFDAFVAMVLSSLAVRSAGGS